MAFDLVIWDCDGCLIDSEILSCGSAARLFREAGYLISDETFVDRFMGWRWPDIHRAISEETGRDYERIVPIEQIGKVRRELFESSLRAIPYVVEAMDAINLPVCIASGSDNERLEHSLRLTGLWERFEGRVFTSHDVPKGKPAPDVFLYAAEKMAARPERCLVIEDSTHGIVAGKAAGMVVFAFTGGSHIRPDLIERVRDLNPHVVFNDMRDLPGLLTTFAN